MSRQVIKVLYWTIIGLFVLLCIKINSIGLIGYDGGSNPFTVFDELIVLGEVHTILEASSLKEFALSVIAGKGYIYGRFIYMCDALIAAIPFYIFGIKGLVFSIRMAHSFYLIFGFHLINRYINTEMGLARLFSLIVFVLFPVTNYFVGMPKPEPMQLLLVGLFFTYRNKDWSWLFLGLALGSKISIAFGCVYLAGLMFYQLYKKELSIRQVLRRSIHGLIGLIIAIPGIPLSIINSHFRSGLVNIVTTASKPYDDPNINFGDWIIELLRYYYNLPFWFSAILVLAIIICALLTLRKHKKYLPYVVFAILTIIPIMLLTKRLWGYYLFFGLVLLIPFVFHFAAQISKNKRRTWVTFLLFLFPFLISTTQAFVDVTLILNRNKSIAYKESKEATFNALVYCNDNYPEKTIGIDLQLYYQYNWYLEPQQNTPRSVAKHTFSIADCIITPVNMNYPKESSNYTLALKNDKINIWVRN